MADYRPASAPANIINHFILIVDESYSMSHLKNTTIKVFDGFIARLAAKSKAREQETRVTVYFFNSYGTERCVIYDMDVLRVPSLAGMYRPDGNTALLRTFLLAIRDLRELPQKYGDHSFAVFGFTDGQENDSARPRTYEAQAKVIAELSGAILTAPDNETYGLFVPDQEGVADAKNFGFPAGNISVWNPNSAEGIEEAGRLMDDVAESYMEGRSRGVRGYSASSGGGLFRMRDFTAAEVTSALTPLSLGSYVMLHVTEKTPIRKFVESCGITYVPSDGKAFYQLTAPVTVQDYKEVVIEHNGQFYTGESARQLLGLPDTGSVKVHLEPKPGMTVFFQSTSVNRNLFGGTRLLVMR
jgi:hypothetical protein